MQRLIQASCVLALIVSIAPQVRAVPQGDDSGSMVIVFKDGHQQTVRLADVRRIEFNPAATASTPTIGRGRFLGTWKVGDGSGGTFKITLKEDGRAEKTQGSPNGTWTVVDGQARISWDDGWHDAIRKVGHQYEKAAFRPGTTFDDKPDNIASAQIDRPEIN